MRDYVHVKTLNTQLMAARMRQPSPSGPGRYMSQAELAEAVNEYIRCRLGGGGKVNGDYVRKFEHGVHRWPNSTYREAFRAVLGVMTDAELGFYNIREQTVSTGLLKVGEPEFQHFAARKK